MYMSARVQVQTHVSTKLYLYSSGLAKSAFCMKAWGWGGGVKRLDHCPNFLDLYNLYHMALYSCFIDQKCLLVIKLWS